MKNFGAIAIFVVYFWFGILKLLDLSPAAPMVNDLLAHTLPFIAPALFMKIFAVYEMVIGLCFLIPKFRKLGIILIIPHLIMTTGPLLLLPDMTWSGLFVPTMEGQYIIKNILIIAVLFTL